MLSMTSTRIESDRCLLYSLILSADPLSLCLHISI